MFESLLDLFKGNSWSKNISQACSISLLKLEEKPTELFKCMTAQACARVATGIHWKQNRREIDYDTYALILANAWFGQQNLKKIGQNT